MRRHGLAPEAQNLCRGVTAALKVEETERRRVEADGLTEVGDGPVQLLRSAEQVHGASTGEGRREVGHYADRLIVVGERAVDVVVAHAVCVAAIDQSLCDNPRRRLAGVDHRSAGLDRLHRQRPARLGIDAAALELTLVVLRFRGAREGENDEQDCERLPHGLPHGDR